MSGSSLWKLRGQVEERRGGRVRKSEEKGEREREKGNEGEGKKERKTVGVVSFH